MAVRRSPHQLDSNCELNSLATAYYRILRPAPLRFRPLQSLSPGSRSALHPDSGRASRLLSVTPRRGRGLLTPKRTVLKPVKTETRMPALELKYLKLVPFRENFYQQTVKNRVVYEPVRKLQVSRKVKVDLELPEVVVHIAQPWSIDSSLDL